MVVVSYSTGSLSTSTVTERTRHPTLVRLAARKNKLFAEVSRRSAEPAIFYRRAISISLSLSLCMYVHIYIYIYTHTRISVYLSLSLSLDVYIYIYIYIEREREGERERELRTITKEIRGDDGSVRKPRGKTPSSRPVKFPRIILNACRRSVVRSRCSRRSQSP